MSDQQRERVGALQKKLLGGFVLTRRMQDTFDVMFGRFRGNFQLFCDFAYGLVLECKDLFPSSSFLPDKESSSLFSFFFISGGVGFTGTSVEQGGCVGGLQKKVIDVFQVQPECF